MGLEMGSDEDGFTDEAIGKVFSSDEAFGEEKEDSLWVTATGEATVDGALREGCEDSLWVTTTREAMGEGSGDGTLGVKDDEHSPWDEAVSSSSE